MPSESKKKQVNAALTPEAIDRLEKARRHPGFTKIPSMPDLIRRFVDEGLDRLEKAPNGVHP